MGLSRFWTPKKLGCRCKLVVDFLFSKQLAWVRFSPPAFFILSRFIMVRIFHKTQKMFFFKNEELFFRTVRSFFQNQKYPTNSRSFIFSYFNFFVREGSISRIRRFCFISKTSRGVSSFLGVSRFFSRKAFGFGFFPGGFKLLEIWRSRLTHTLDKRKSPGSSPGVSSY